MVDRISAADNLTIELQPDRWRLIANGSMEETVVVEASPGKPLRYVAGFGRTRRLPDSGALPVEHIQRVVLGWSQQDEAWHLGFVLTSELAQARGSRWCEVAHWPDPDTNVYDDIALTAGKSLAQAVSRPFYLVPPNTEPARPAPAATVPERELPSLPIKLDLWTFERTGIDGYQLVRSRRYSLSSIRRILWYALWLVVYIILVYTTFTAGIAPARPEWLPYLGIAAASLMVVLILRNIYSLLTEPNRIVVDKNGRNVRALIGDRERWLYFARDQVQSVYVTHIITTNRRNPRSSQSYFYSELNLQLSSNQFQYILNMEQPKKIASATMEGELGSSIMPITPNDVETDMQAVGMYIAQALGVPCYYDRRT